MPDHTISDHAAPEDPGTFKRAIRKGIASARENALPGLFLWALAAAIVAGYYFFPPMTGALGRLGKLKASAGYLYSAIATGIFGGLIPALWRLRVNAKKKAPGSVSAFGLCFFLGLFWAYKGIEVDFFYRIQAMIFGTGATPATIIPKVLVDQFVYNPLWAGWTQVLAYWWMENRFRPSALTDRALWGTMGERVITILISTWGVWIPMVSIIYAMPPDLQIPLFNIALCFWSLMLASLTREKHN